MRKAEPLDDAPVIDPKGIAATGRPSSTRDSKSAAGTDSFEGSYCPRSRRRFCIHEAKVGYLTPWAAANFIPVMLLAS